LFEAWRFFRPPTAICPSVAAHCQGEQFILPTHEGDLDYSDGFILDIDMVVFVKATLLILLAAAAVAWIVSARWMRFYDGLLIR
jgi:hypothetical protein